MNVVVANKVLMNNANVYVYCDRVLLVVCYNPYYGNKDKRN